MEKARYSQAASLWNSFIGSFQKKTGQVELDRGILLQETKALIQETKAPSSEIL
jgi:hypothetical protein